MPNIKSAKKRVLVAETKTLQNKILKTALKTSLKKYTAAVEAGDKETATALYKEAVKKLDRAVNQGLIHRNAAAHKKSQFTLILNKMA